MSVISTPSVASLTSGPSVALGSAPLMRHKMTFSHFSKDLIRPPVSGGQFAGAVRGLVFLFTQRTQRTQSYNANYAAAEVVAGYARQSAQRQRKTNKWKLSTPSVASLLVPLSQRDSQLLLANAITHFLPLRQVGVPRRGGGGG